MFQSIFKNPAVNAYSGALWKHYQILKDIFQPTVNPLTKKHVFDSYDLTIRTQNFLDSLDMYLQLAISKFVSYNIVLILFFILHIFLYPISQRTKYADWRPSFTLNSRLFSDRKIQPHLFSQFNLKDVRQFCLFFWL